MEAAYADAKNAFFILAINRNEPAQPQQIRTTEKKKLKTKGYSD
jgi:hypothetical protein